MKTPMEIFKKHGAHYYENDEQAIIDAMTEYAEQQVKNLNIPDVINCVRTCLCENPVHDIEDASMCGNCGEDLGEHCC